MWKELTPCLGSVWHYRPSKGDMEKIPDLVTCAPTDYVMDAAKLMEDNNIGCILITDNNNLKGILLTAT